MMTRCVAALAAVGLLAACQPDGTVGQRTGAGAILGAVGGAVVGGLIGDRRGALIGAGIGTVAGAAVGAQLDAQQRELERNLEGTGATVTNTGEEIRVNLPAGVTFAFDRAEIQPQFVEPLTRVSRTLAQYESSLIDVVGHTDSVGSAAYNQDLSQRRADTVADFMSRRGVLPARIAAFGRGEDQPVASNETESGRALNRRVEIVITPLTEG